MRLLALAACASPAPIVENHVPAAPAPRFTGPWTFETLAVTLAPSCGESPRLAHLTAWGFRVSACGTSMFVRCSEVDGPSKICCRRMTDENTTTEETWQGTTEDGGTCKDSRKSEAARR